MLHGWVEAMRRVPDAFRFRRFCSTANTPKRQVSCGGMIGIIVYVDLQHVVFV